MIRFATAVAAALLLAGCRGEQQTPEPSPALWHLAGRNGEQGWLFGTIHALPDGAEWRTPKIERAFAESDVLMVEIGDLDDSSAGAKAFDTFARSENLPALTARIAPADRPALQALMQRAGMDDADFWNVETWAAALLLANAVSENEPENGVDRDLLDDGKPVEALETFAGQFDRFDRLGEAEQRELLAAVARQDAEGADEQATAWLTGDLAALATELDDAFTTQPALRRSLLVERNALFAARVAETIERRRVPFVAVGAGHMLGPEGLPALLSARGYTVTRVQ